MTEMKVHHFETDLLVPLYNSEVVQYYLSVCSSVVSLSYSVNTCAHCSGVDLHCL